jgi:hypothetical protein
MYEPLILVFAAGRLSKEACLGQEISPAAQALDEIKHELRDPGQLANH